MNVEMLLDLVNQISSERKVKRYFGHPSLRTLRTSWGRSESTSQGCPLNVRLRCPQDVRLRRLRDCQIGSLGDVQGDFGEGRPQEVLGTNICQLDNAN